MDSTKLSIYASRTLAYITRVSMHSQTKDPSLEIGLETGDVQRQSEGLEAGKALIGFVTASTI